MDWIRHDHRGEIYGLYIVHVLLYENGEQTAIPTFELPVIWDPMMHISTDEISFEIQIR